MSKPRLDYDRIKAEFSILDVARQLGLEVDNNNRSKSIFEPGSDNTCTLYYPDTNSFHDWKATRGGSVLDLVAQVKYGNTDKEAIYQAAQFLAGDKYYFDGKYWKSWIIQRKNFERQIELRHKFLLNSSHAAAVYAREYLINERGISIETIKRFKIGICKKYIQYADGFSGYEPRLYIPYLDRNDKPFYGAHRRLDKFCHAIVKENKYQKDSKKKSEFLRNEPLGINTLPTHKKDFDLLVISEGAIDWLTAVQEGFHSLSSVCGSFGKDNEVFVIAQCKKFRRVITTYDIDVGSQAGQNFTVKFGLKLLKAGINFYNVDNFGEGNKDLSDYYTHGGNLKELFSQHIICGAVFIARRLNAEYGGVHFRQLSVVEQDKLFKSVRELVQLAKNVVSDEEYKAVREAIKVYLPEQKLKEAEAEPTEKELINERRDIFLTDHEHLFFYGDIKHGTYYDYDKDIGIWRIITDAELQHNIAQRFSFKLSPKQVRDITDAVRLVRTIKGLPEFNKKPLINFRNGTLELDTGTFREHRPDDYCMSVTPYDYDAKADCPMFKKFLLEVTDNNESRLNTLRDTFGYILYPNCKLQKMFIWYGRGNNGKNTLADTVGAVFETVGQDKKAPFVTGEPLSKFMLPTTRIMLMYSGLNIASEASINLRGNEDVIKKFCSGDLIDGNRKFCDTEYFRSRTKIICCCNEIPTLNDNTYGMTRRLIFVEFVRDFTKQLDADLQDKLKTEIAGVFNYIYQCYLELKQRNYIRECCDQSKLLREFSNNASSVYSFYDSYRHYYSGQTMPTKYVWNEYLKWCKESFIPALEVKRNKNFQTEFLRLIEKDGSKRERIRINGKQTLCYVFATLEVEAGDIQDVDDIPEPEPESHTVDVQEAYDVTDIVEPEIQTEAVNIQEVNNTEAEQLESQSEANDQQEQEHDVLSPVQKLILGIENKLEPEKLRSMYNALEEMQQLSVMATLRATFRSELADYLRRIVNE